LTIAPTDKMKNNLRFTCSQYYKRVLHYKITTEPTLLVNQKILPYKLEPQQKPAYKQLTITPEKAIEKHQTYLEKYNIPTSAPALPYVYIIFKCHKNSSRGVTAAYKVTTSHLAKILHACLKLMLEEQLKKAKTNSILNNIDTIWRINTSTDLTHKLHHLNQDEQHTPTTLQTYDIEGFYDNVDLPKLASIIQHFIPKMFQLTRCKYIKVNPRTYNAEWITYIPKDTRDIIMTENTITKLQTWHLNNFLIIYNNKVWKQIKGIGQGTNQSPDLADIILGHYKEKFIKKH